MKKKEEEKAPVSATTDMEKVNAQLQAMLQQANERMQQIVAQARQIEQLLRDKTVDQMFNVIKYAHEFEPEFVEKCAKAIAEYISNIAFAAEEEKEKQPVRPLNEEPTDLTPVE